MRYYLDHAATTPLLPAALEAMQRWLVDGFGNPSSLYQEGLEAKKAVDEARETLSDAAGCLFGEFIFTGSGTEAGATAIIGAALAASEGRRRVLISRADHHCVLHTIPTLQRLGFQVTRLAVDREARVDLNFLREVMDDSVLLVAAMHANNELGTYNDVRAIGEMAHIHGALFFCDAVQSFPISDLHADLMSVSAHKLGGPKGVGGLVVRSGVQLKPLLAGGGQEREMRGGTENVAGIVGFAAAVREQLRRPELAVKKRAARDAFAEVLAGSPAVRTTESETLPGHLHVRFPGITADSLLIRLDRMGVAASSGAACSSGSIEPSHVLQACGYSEAAAQEGMRFTFGADMTPQDARAAGRIVMQAVQDISALNQPL
jgi:cysteine desulfurase